MSQDNVFEKGWLEKAIAWGAANFLVFLSKKGIYLLHGGKPEESALVKPKELTELFGEFIVTIDVDSVFPKDTTP